MPRHPAGPGGACTGTHSSPTATRPLLGSAGRRWPLLLQRNSARPTWKSPHSSVEARGPPGHVGAPRRGCRPAPARLPPSALLRSLCGRSPFATACHSTVPHPPCEPGPQHPRPGARRSPALGRDSKHRAEAPRPQHARHVPRSARGQGAAGPEDGAADEVQSAPSAGTLGQRSAAPPTTAQHLAGGLNGLRSEAAGTSAPGPCPPRTERSPPPAPAEPRGLPATWGQLAGEAATRLLRPRVLRNSGTSERAPGPTAGPWFSKTGEGGT